MRIIDMHCDTLLEGYIKKQNLRNNRLSVDLKTMKSNEALGQFFAIFLPTGIEARTDGLDEKPYDLFIKLNEFYKCEMRENEDLIRPAISYDDIIENKRNNKMSAFLTVEDGQLLENRIERIDELYHEGVRLLTLTWNNENCIGFPASANQEGHMRGLKPFGIEVIKRMNDLGMIVDVSHLSEGGFYDVARHSVKPFVASHSCARALCNHHRNLTDNQLKCIAESGGIVGVNFNAPFLREKSSKTFAEDVVEHIRYMISVMGGEHVAFGSDFDGINCNMEFGNYIFFKEVICRLEKIFPDETVEKICCKNVLRILKECL